MHLRSGDVTSEPWGQERIWAVLSSAASQKVHAADCTFPSLANLSLLGRRVFRILKRNDFCSGAGPNFLESLYGSEKSKCRLFSSSLDLIRTG